MKPLLGLSALVCAAAINVAQAYEYRLQFTPNAGARGLVVAGYAFQGDTVLGNCSYYTVRSGSGRGGGYHTVTTHYNQTCTWDLYGNLLGIAQGAPAVPTPIYTIGTQTVYATNVNGDFTGSDSKLAGGFVDVPGPHYRWLTSNAYAVLQQARQTISVMLVSDGELPLTVSAVAATALSGTIGATGSTCIGVLAPGVTCVVNVSYDPTALRSPTGLAYDTLTISVTSDAGQASDFVQSYTIILIAPPDDEGDAVPGEPTVGSGGGDGIGGGS